MGRRNVPGPGTYEIPAHLQTGGQSTFNVSSKQGKSGFITAEPRNFKATGAHNFATKIGPGDYTIGKANGGVHTGKDEPLGQRSARSYNKHAAGGTGTFGSTSRRSTGPKAYGLATGLLAERRSAERAARHAKLPL